MTESYLILTYKNVILFYFFLFPKQMFHWFFIYLFIFITLLSSFTNQKYTKSCYQCHIIKMCAVTSLYVSDPFFLFLLGQLDFSMSNLYMSISDLFHLIFYSMHPKMCACISRPKEKNVLVSFVQCSSDNMQVEERLVTVDELLDADEVFCTGTAVVVSPVGSITYLGKR